MTAKPNALGTLWGPGRAETVQKADAIRARDCVAMQGEAEQEVLTPPSIVAALLDLWPEGVALDPCGPVTGSLVQAATSYTGAPLDGLREPWADRTYCNPPYSDLGAWLAKAQNEAAKGLEVALLVPVRTHRAWFQLDAWPRVSFLRPLAFVGHDQAFPAPLVVLYSGERLEAFDAAFSGLGRVGTFCETYRRQGRLL